MKLKNKFIIVTTLLLSLIAGTSHAVCSNFTTFADGQVLTAGNLNSLQTHYTNCVNDVLSGNTFTGDLNMHSGADILMYTDTGSTKTIHLDTATGEILGAPKAVGVPYNLNAAVATTTNANDSIKIECGNTACSATNPGYIWLPDDSVTGDMELFKVVADVTIDLTGAHWGIGTTGDITDAILRVSPVNAAGTLVWCVNYQGGRQVIISTEDSTTGTDINLPNEYLCSAAVAANNPVVDSVFWFKANFDDTGGAAEDLWAVQTGDGDINRGSADGQVQSYNVAFTGYSAPPTATSSTFYQVGKNVCVEVASGAGTSNATSTTISLPIVSDRSQFLGVGFGRDNGVDFTSPCRSDANNGTAIAQQYLDMSAASWTASGGKFCTVRGCYQAQ
jgi:hypothetical protein